MNRYCYEAYGLTFDLPFPCAHLTPAAEGQIKVFEGPVPDALPSPVVRDGWSQADSDRRLVVGGSRQGRFLVDRGDVTLQRGDGDELALGRGFTSLVLPALLYQRGLLVLHASAAAINDAAIILTGESGAGKSTTLTALMRDGCSMLSDDVTAVRLADSGAPEAVPGVGRVRLTPDAADGLGVGADDDIAEPDRRGKRSLAPVTALAPAAVPVRIVCELADHDGAELRVHRLGGTATFQALQDCIYGPLLADEHARLFPICGAILERVAFFRIERPQSRWTVPEVSAAILQLAAAAPTEARTVRADPTTNGRWSPSTTA
jgi:hypothetical protein